MRVPVVMNGGTAVRTPFDSTAGLYDDEAVRVLVVDRRGQDPFVDRERDLHLRLEVGGLVADDIGRERDLVVVLHIHEMEAVAVLIKKLMFAFLDRGTLDLLGRLVALLRLYAIADPAHVNLRGRRAFAGMEAFGVEHDVKLTVEVEDIALAER